MDSFNPDDCQKTKIDGQLYSWYWLSEQRKNKTVVLLPWCWHEGNHSHSLKDRNRLVNIKSGYIMIVKRFEQSWAEKALYKCSHYYYYSVMINTTQKKSQKSEFKSVETFTVITCQWGKRISISHKVLFKFDITPGSTRKVGKNVRKCHTIKKVLSESMQICYSHSFCFSIIGDGGWTETWCLSSQNTFHGD